MKSRITIERHAKKSRGAHTAASLPAGGEIVDGNTSLISASLPHVLRNRYRASELQLRFASDAELSPSESPQLMW